MLTWTVVCSIIIYYSPIWSLSPVENCHFFIFCFMTIIFPNNEAEKDSDEQVNCWRHGLTRGDTASFVRSKTIIIFRYRLFKGEALLRFGFEVPSRCCSFVWWLKDSGNWFWASTTKSESGSNVGNFEDLLHKYSIRHGLSVPEWLQVFDNVFHVKLMGKIVKWKYHALYTNGKNWRTQFLSTVLLQIGLNFMGSTRQSSTRTRNSCPCCHECC
jgi:hypothetical protein